MADIINTAIEFVSEKRCSEEELRTYLDDTFVKLPESEKKIEEAFLFLRENQVVDDLRLAHHFASHYTHKGDRFITQQLLQRRINPVVIRQVLKQLPSEKTRALNEASKRIEQLGIQNPGNDLKNRITRFLNGRHFSLVTVQGVLNQLNSKTCAEVNKTQFEPYRISA